MSFQLTPDGKGRAPVPNSLNLTHTNTVSEPKVSFLITILIKFTYIIFGGYKKLATYYESIYKLWTMIIKMFIVKLDKCQLYTFIYIL